MPRMPTFPIWLHIIHLYLVAICFSSSVEPETLLVYAARFFAMCPMSVSHSPENSPNAPITSPFTCPYDLIVRV